MHRADGNRPIERGLLIDPAAPPAEGGGASDAGATTPATRRRTNGPGDIGGVGGADGKTGTAIREYVLQNWRADVVCVVTPPGDAEEAPEALDHVRYSAYGVPVAGIHLAAEAALADRDADGDADLADLDDFLTDFNASDPSADLDSSGTVTVDDLLAYLGRFRAGSRYQDRGAIGLRTSPAAAALRHSYAGYLAEQDLDGTTHLVRHRWLLSELGQWNRRDPLGYVDGMGLFEYVGGNTIRRRDPTGLAWANWNFALWYILGTGITIDLGQVGLGDEYESHEVVRESIRQMSQEIEAKAASKGKSLASGLNCCEDSSVTTEFSESSTDHIGREFVRNWDPGTPNNINTIFWFSDWTYSIGGHSLSIEADCVCYAECMLHSRPWYCACAGEATMSDVFSDPLNFRELFGFPYDFSKSYKATYSFGVAMGASGEVLGRGCDENDCK